MTLRELIFKYKPNIEDIRTIEDMYWLIEEIFNISQGEVPFHYEDEIDDFVFFSLWEKLKNKTIQHVLGYGYFLGEKIKINEHVLIPRNETEELVLHVLKVMKYNNYNSILDIGVGSGAILLSIEKQMKEKGIDILGLGVDISKEALEIADFNLKQLNLKSKVVLSNVYENVRSKYDVIVSNPPYIDKDEFVEKRVYDNEPHIALFADNHGLDIYVKILKDAYRFINKGGLIALEISPERKEGLEKIINKYIDYKKYEFVKDINGFIRFCYIYLN